MRNGYSAAPIVILSACPDDLALRGSIATRTEGWNDVPTARQRRPAVRLHHRRRGLGGLRPRQPAQRRWQESDFPHRSRRQGQQLEHSYPADGGEPAAGPEIHLAVHDREAGASQRQGAAVGAGARARRLQLDQRQCLCPRRSGRVRFLEQPRLPGLELGGHAALFQEDGDLCRGRAGQARPWRTHPRHAAEKFRQAGRCLSRCQQPGRARTRQRL